VRGDDDLIVPGEDNVIDLQDWRAARRPAQLPPELLAEVEAAARVYDALVAQGHELRFDVPEDGGHVRAELRSVDGDVVRRVRLTEVLGLDGPAGAA
jgi:hypothetical protein